MTAAERRSRPGRRRLVDLAHARAGDKGDQSIMMLAPYDPADFARLSAAVTAERIAEHFGVPAAQVRVTPAAALSAFTIVVERRLDGGVTRSRTVDPHGKTLASHLLDLLIDWPEAP